MKTLSLAVMATIFSAALVMTVFAADKDKPTTEKQGVLRHVVAFKFKETATADQIKEVENAFRALKQKIPQIAELEWGLNNSPEGLNKGFTHVFILTFKTEKDREIYLPHPDHKAFGKSLGPILADVFVVDFWAQK
jgi:hypothetical protein